MTPQQRFEQAYDAGRRARQVGKARSQSPMYGPGEDGQRHREAWRDGWDAEDQQRRRRA